MTARFTLLLLLGMSGNALAGTTETCLAEGVLSNWTDPVVATCGIDCQTAREEAALPTCESGQAGCELPANAIAPPKRPAGPQCIEGGPLCMPQQPGMTYSVRTNLVLVFPELNQPVYRAGTLPTAGLPEYKNHHENWLNEPSGPPPRS